jgi:hypothetical protein
MPIPSGTKFHGVAPSVDTTDKGSASRDALRDAYTIEDFVTATTGVGPLGWGRYDDSQYTAASPFVIDEVDGFVVLPNNAATTVLGPGNYNLYDSGTQKVLGLNENDTYVLTIAFNASAANANQTHLDWKLVGSGDISRVAGTIAYHKGNDEPQAENVVVQYYTDAGFVASGVDIQFQSHGGQSKVWDIIYFIQRTQYGG